MTWVLGLAGAALVLVTLRDIFHTLWHPRGFGSLCRLLFRLVWHVTDRLMRHRSSELAGPLGLLVVAVAWAALIVLGWTLVYLPHMPDGFIFDSSLTPQRSSDVLASAYLSLVAVATLGFGDIVPAEPLLRMLVPVQALIGFVLFTAVISWVLQVYPALIQRRALARRLSLLRAHHAHETVARAQDPSVPTQLLLGLSEEITVVEMDLLQYGETYYFRESESDLSMAAALPYARRLAAAGHESRSHEVVQAAAVLDDSVGRLAALLDREYLHTGGSVDQTLEAFAHDHRQAAITG